MYNVSYDLKEPRKNYDAVLEEIRKRDYVKVGGSSYLVATNETADQLNTAVRRHMDENDTILVIEVTRNRAGWLPKLTWDWIGRHGV